MAHPAVIYPSSPNMQLFSPGKAVYLFQCYATSSVCATQEEELPTFAHVSRVVSPHIRQYVPEHLALFLEQEL